MPEPVDQPTSPIGTEGAPNSNAAEILYPEDQPKVDADVDTPQQETESKSDAQAGTAYDLKMPDGVPLDQELLGQATPVLRQLGLTNDQANQLVPLVGKVQERVMQAQEIEFDVMKTAWAKQTKSDPNIGGKNWPETERLCALAMNAGGAGPGSEFRELLNDSGLGNHPAVVRVFRSLGHQLAGKVKASGRSREEILYPDDVPR